MNAYLAFFLGLFTVLLIIIIAYIVALYSTRFRQVYLAVFSNFGTTPDPNAPTPPAT